MSAEELPALTYQEVHLWGLQMHLLLGSGTPLHEGLELLATSEDLPRISLVCDRLAEGISQGKCLSQVMRSLHPTFSELVVSYVAVGEKSGRLHEVFARVAERSMRLARTEQTVRSALAYPVFLTLVSLAMAGFMAFYMFPQLLPLLTGLGVGLPWPTRALLWCSHYLAWLLALLVVISGWVGYVLAADGSPRVERVRDWLLYQSPVVGRLNRNRVYSDCLGDLAMLLEAQGDLLASISSLRPPWFQQRERLRACVKAIQTGSSVSQAVEESRVLPRWLLSPMSAAEETGQLAETFQYLSRQMEEAVLTELERMLQLLEPIMMGGMGLVTGFIVLATFLPLYSITSRI